MADMLYRALVVDDEPAVRKATIRAFVEERFACDAAANGTEAKQLLAANRYDVVVTDLQMPNGHGHALAMELLAIENRPAIVVSDRHVGPRLAKDLIGRGSGVRGIQARPLRSVGSQDQGHDEPATASRPNYAAPLISWKLDLHAVRTRRPRPARERSPRDIIASAAIRAGGSGVSPNGSPGAGLRRYNGPPERGHPDARPQQRATGRRTGGNAAAGGRIGSGQNGTRANRGGTRAEQGHPASRHRKPAPGLLRHRPRRPLPDAECRQQANWGDAIGKRPEDVAGTEENISLWLENNRRASPGRRSKAKWNSPSKAKNASPTTSSPRSGRTAKSPGFSASTSTSPSGNAPRGDAEGP